MLDSLSIYSMQVLLDSIFIVYDSSISNPASKARHEVLDKICIWCKSYLQQPDSIPTIIIKARKFFR